MRCPNLRDKVILKYLDHHKKRFLTTSEIAKAVKMQHHTVRNRLERLEGDNLLEHASDRHLTGYLWRLKTATIEMAKPE